MLNRGNDLSVFVVKWLATRNPILFAICSNQIRSIFCDTFFFKSALFPLLFFFIYFVFFLCSFQYLFTIIFLFMFYSLQVYLKFSMQTIRDESQTSPPLAVSVIESITSLSTFPFAGCICLRNCFISICPRTI